MIQKPRDAIPQSKPAEPAGAPSLPNMSSRSDVDAFLAQVRSLSSTAAPGRRGRLIFALDATMSRQPTWDTACRLQAEMFREAAAVGRHDVQLAYYRGFGPCRATGWASHGERIAPLPTPTDWQSGHNPDGKTLVHS